VVGVPLVLLVVAAIVSAVVLAVRASTHRDGPGVATGGPTPGPAPEPSGLDDDLARWCAAGLLSQAQADAIRAHEVRIAAARTRPAAAPDSAASAPVPPQPVRARRIPVVAEALGYLGGALALGGLALLLGRSWPDLATAGRLALSGGGAAALLGAGALVREEAEPALARLRGFLWLAGTGAAALFAGVLVADGVGAAPKTVLLAGAGAVALLSAQLWRGLDRPLQQVTCLASVAVFAGALVSEFATAGPIGLAVWAVGAALLALGLARVLPGPGVTEATGAVAVITGAAITLVDWPGFGLLFGVATALGLLALALGRGLAPTRAEQVMFGVVGGLALAQAGPSTLAYYAGEAGVATGVATWTLGAMLVYASTWRAVRARRVVEGLGAAALLGGAAVTATQSVGLATVAGIVTSLGLVVAGMLPGQVLLSVFGSLGLLVYVPWAIGWFFPGEGRAPLLVMVSGALLIGVAVLLTRLGGRFRRELGGPGSRRGPGGAPGGMAARSA
jgi:hypothetical protein